MANHNILVPTDFSECALNALRAAVNIAIKMKTEVLIFHAFKRTVTKGQYGVNFLEKAITQEEEMYANEEFRIIRKQIPQLAAVPYEFVTAHGLLANEVEELIAPNKIGLVIMGTKGAYGIDEVLIGSNAYEVIKNTSVPVLLIPEHAALPIIDKIVLAGDCKPFEEAILKPLRIFAKIYKAEIHIVHVSKYPDSPERKAEQTKIFDKQFEDIKHVYRLVENQSIEDGIFDYCDINQVNILAVAPRKKKLFDALFGTSETKKIAFHSSIPVLTLPEQISKL